MAVSQEEAAMAAAPAKKHPNFLRLLWRSASNQKQGLAVVALSTSCLFLSLSMLNHKRQNEDLQQHLSSLQKDNDSLRETIAAAVDVVFSSSVPPSPSSSSASAPVPSSSPLVASATTELPISPSTGRSGFMV